MSLRENFVDRHIGPDQVEIQRMLDELGEDSLQSLIAKVVPENIVINQKLVDLLPQGISEVAAIERLKGFASENAVMRSYIGIGYYGTRRYPHHEMGLRQIIY